MEGPGKRFGGVVDVERKARQVDTSSLGDKKNPGVGLGVSSECMRDSRRHLRLSLYMECTRFKDKV